MFFKNGVLKNFSNFTENVLESLFNKVVGLKACNFIKNTAAQVFSYEISLSFKNTFLQNTSGACFWKGSVKEQA